MARPRRTPTASERSRIPWAEVEAYLRTGSVADPAQGAWPGQNLFERVALAHEVLRGALVDEVLRRAGGVRTPRSLRALDPVAFTRGRVEPMVRGLFPGREHEVVLGILEKAVVFLTPGNIQGVLREERWDHTAWDLANLYLGSVGATLLGDEEPARIVGLSQETTCFVTMGYFEVEDPFADFVVHECAHIFHNWKRESCRLPATRTREWLLPIEYRKRETFAYACEAYSRIRVLARGARERRALVEEHAAERFPGEDEGVDHTEYVDILGEAVGARNGWKRILQRCAPVRRRRVSG